MDLTLGGLKLKITRHSKCAGKQRITVQCTQACIKDPVFVSPSQIFEFLEEGENHRKNES